jgi:hypothetical protein
VGKIEDDVRLRAKHRRTLKIFKVKMAKGQHKLNREGEYRCPRPKTAVLSDPMHFGHLFTANFPHRAPPISLAPPPGSPCHGNRQPNGNHLGGVLRSVVRILEFA